MPDRVPTYEILIDPKAMRQALEASAAGISLEVYAEDHEPLRIALEKWK